MDATKAVLNALYDALRNDPDLAALMGAGWEGPYHRTPVDAAWPFLTHKLEILAGDWGI